MFARPSPCRPRSAARIRHQAREGQLLDYIEYCTLLPRYGLLVVLIIVTEYTCCANLDNFTLQTRKLPCHE